jgi:hypothetical protein
MKQTIFILLTIFVFSCAPVGHENVSKNDVGDIPFDKILDDENFKTCNETNINQYYVRYSADTRPGYQGEKKGLDKAILSKYSFQQSEQENGYVTIRFIVNCKGETGRFRIEEMDFAYKPRKFDSKISHQLLEIVKNLKEWIPRKSNGENLDFYQYLTFKIEKGQIVKILP